LQFYHKKNIHKSIQTHITLLYFFFFLFFCFFLHPQYKNINSKQLNKNYIKQFQNYKTATLKQSEITGMALCKPEQCRRVCPRATVAGGAWVHAPPLTMPGNGRICPAFFFPSLLCWL